MPPTVATFPYAAPDSDADAYSDGSSDDRGSSRSLDEIGAVAVLGAMVEQRRRSSSIPSPSELDVDADAIATQRRQRLDPNDDVFQKIR
ncbi:MAG: hypothetical protein KF764_29560 [Labilithrix sp.]|nr:hypothetical protein [Labilithrix sp.]MBX3220031.1 hypothetical protein [Labilithrix sp.]